MARSELTISALGVDIVVSLDSHLTPDEEQDLTKAWAPAGSTGHDRSVALSAGIIRGGRTTSPDVIGVDFRDLASNLSTRVTLAAIEQRKSELIMFHACGVASPSGEVIAFVGPSGRGKTTLASNVATSWGYVTDETVGVTPEGVVLPYRKPLSVIEPESVYRHKTQVSADELKLKPLPKAPLRLAAIVLINRIASGAEPPRVSPVALVDALVELVPEMSYLPLLDKPLQQFAELITRVGGVQRVSYTEAASLNALLPQFVANSRTPIAAHWSPLPVGADPSVEALESSEMIEAFQRISPQDGISVDNTYVLLHDRFVRVLDGIGPIIWDSLERPATLSEVTEAVVLAIGAPESGDAKSIVKRAIDDLVSEGLVRRHTEIEPVA